MKIKLFLALADLPGDRLVEFYRSLLGLEPVIYQADRYAEFRLADGVRLALFAPKCDQEAEFAIAPGASSGGLSLCWPVADLESEMARLTGLGARLGPVTIASHGREVYAYDPAGNRLIVYESFSTAHE